MTDFAYIETLKQESKMCGKQEQFNKFFSSLSVNSAYQEAKKCLYDVGVNKGYSVEDAKKYADEDFVPEIVSKINGQKMQQDKTVICRAIENRFNKLGY